MLPLRPDHTSPARQPETVKDSKCLADLRQTIARMQAPVVGLDAAGEAPLGVLEIDRALGGGLARGALHEIAACGEAHVAAAAGFVLGVAALPFVPAKAGTQGLENDRSSMRSLDSRLRGNERSLLQTSSFTRMASSTRGEERKAIVWAAEDMALVESGAPYGPGLDLFGLAPERLLTVTGAKAGDVLWTMEQALHCRAVGVVIGEVRSTSRELDLVATRRLSLAAAAHGALALLLRTAPGAEASAAATRWVAGAAPSRKGSIGPPRFDLALTRNRRGPLGSWMLEWSVSDVSFVLATHPQPVARTIIDRSDRAHAA